MTSYFNYFNYFNYILSFVEKNISKFIDDPQILPTYSNNDNDKCKDFNIDNINFNEFGRSIQPQQIVNNFVLFIREEV